MKEWGIRTRVLFLAVVPLTVTVLLLASHFINARLEELERALVDRGQAIARQLAPACEYGVLAGNRRILDRLAGAALLEADVVSVAITDRHDHLLAGAAGGRRRPMQAGGLSDAVARTAEDVAHARVQGDYVFRAPVFRSRVTLEDVGEEDAAARALGAGAAGGELPIGWVVVALDEAATRAKQNRVLAEGLAITLVGLVVTTLIALWMARGVTEPIRLLTRAVERIKNGALGERVVTRSGGELGLLESGVNAMAEALERARDEEKRRAEDALFHEKVRAQVTLASIGDGVITTDQAGHIVYMNAVAQQFTGWRAEEAEGRPLDEVFRLIDEAAGRSVRYPLHYCLQDGRVIRHDSHHLLVNTDGAKLEIQDSAAPIRDRDGTILGAVVVFRDVTEIQHMVRRMAFLASHDPLTGLINRREFESRLHQALESALSGGQEHALCYIDLDQFKIVNDTSGHVAGDELLKQLAHHLGREIRASDTLARLGGDEFGVILENCAIDKALAIAEILRQAVTDFRFVWQSRTYQVGASIGLVPINHDSGSLTELLSAADSACYVAKDRGRNRIHVYQPDDAALAQRSSEMLWVNRLRHGLDNNSFDLYAQPISPLADARHGPEGFYEILVRIQDEELVLPTAFIPAAERYHLMPAIDRWVIYTAFTLLADFYRRQPTPRTHFAINLSGQSLSDDNFLQFVMTQFDASGVAPATICFEITETAAVANLPRARTFIARLKELGCRFALDDFGSGLSSFGYLKSLPVDYLKIAGEFIRGMADEPVEYAMVDAINQIGHVMGLSTIAESVEEPAVISMLRDLGVNYVQGLAIEGPRPLHEVLQLSEGSWVAARTSAQAILR
jgi:diguanylate cyclase (GGDEF)-like protein/PAS domain S-box-containing protein